MLKAELARDGYYAYMGNSLHECVEGEGVDGVESLPNSIVMQRVQAKQIKMQGI